MNETDLLYWNLLILIAIPYIDNTKILLCYLSDFNDIS